MAALQAGSSKRLMVGITHPNTILGWRSLGSRRERAEFMFPYFTVHGRGLGALSSPSFRIRESPRQHQAVGTRHRLMPALGERRARGKSGWVCRETAVHSHQGTPPRVLGAAGTQSRGLGTHKGPSVQHKGRPVLLALDHPRMARKSRIQRWLGQPPSARGVLRGPQLGPAGRRWVQGSPPGLMLQDSWAVPGRREVVLRGEQTRVSRGHQAPWETGSVPVPPRCSPVG